MATQTLTGPFLGQTRSARPDRQPLIQMLMQRMIQARQRHADRVVARYLQDSGWKFTDSAERSIERTLIGGTTFGVDR